ncbi:protein of unknown function [Azospirillum lipoferum 4B]|uniref:Uncharacterized protein n=1 Tax=Azospirillum lipoferum (strain 4B) TaxID=862719 RepID=G7Z1V0_AZOL4|nr:protein of unknown function [Azospirillum lipoferum 4B]
MWHNHCPAAPKLGLRYQSPADCTANHSENEVDTLVLSVKVSSSLENAALRRGDAG